MQLRPLAPGDIPAAVALGRAFLAAAGFRPDRTGPGLVLLEVRPEELIPPAPVPGATCELAGADDVAGIRAIAQAAAPPGPPLPTGSVRAWCASPLARVFTIRQGGELAGFARLGLRPPSLAQLTLAPGRDRPDLAAHLGAHALQEGWRLLGPLGIVAAVPADEPERLRLYAGLGFRRPVHLQGYSRAGPAGARPR